MYHTPGIQLHIYCGYKCGIGERGSKKLKILKSSETSKSAFFSFVGEGVQEHTVPITMCQAMYYPMEKLTLQTLSKEWTQITV